MFTVSTATVRFVLAGLGTLGADPGALARQAGLPVWALGDNTARIPGAQLAGLLRASRVELAGPGLGAHLGCQWRYGALHVYDYLFGTAATLGEALAVGCRYIGIVNGDDGTAIGLIEEDDGVTFVHGARQGVDAEVSAVMAELGLSVLVTRVRRLLGRDIAPLRAALAGAAPASHRELADAFGTRWIDFGAGRSAVTFARADLGLPMPGADPGLAAVLRGHAEALIAAPGITPRWIDRFRQVLAVHLAAGDLSLAAVARRLGISPRTVQRRLEEEGTSWRTEADALLREQATRLRQEGLSRPVVAARLGYSDARALRRAARRWEAGGRRGH
jgi:AraC-like DNA-binding protein